MTTPPTPGARRGRLRTLACWVVASLLVAIALTARRTGAAEPTLLGVGQDKSAPSAAPSTAVRQDFKRPGSPENGPAPFITRALDVQMETLGKMSEHLVLPTSEKTDAPFYDVPFAVHVPFEVPFEGGSVRVFFDVNIVWDEPERALDAYEFSFKRRAPLFRGTNHWTVFNQGLYRLDGAALSPATLTWEIDAKSVTRFSTPANPPFPVLLLGETPRPGLSQSNNVMVDSGALQSDTPRRAFGAERQYTGRSLNALSRPLVLRPAKSGWYALWFTLAPTVTSWPLQPLRADDTLRATVYVHTMVYRPDRTSGGDYFSWSELDYLWEGAEQKPARVIDAKLIRLHTVTLPLRLQRDGWVYAGTKITTEPDGEKMLQQTLASAPRDAYQANAVKAQVSQTPRGAALTYHVDTYRRETLTTAYAPPPVFGHTMKWDAAFPPVVPDGSVAEIIIAGSAESTGLPEELRRPVGQRREAVPLWIDPVTTRVIAPRDPFRLQDTVLTWIANSVFMERAKYVDRWAWRLDDEACRYWLPASDLNPPKPEDSGRKIYRYYAGLLNPRDVTAPMELRRMLYEDRGPHTLFSFNLGPWNVDALYRRAKDVRPDLASVSVSAQTRIIQEKDPFWEWFPQYSRLVKQKLTEAQAALAEAATLGVVIQYHERRARPLLRAVQAQAENAQGANFLASGTLATVSDQAFNRMLAEARKYSQLARDDRTHALRRMDDAVKAYTELELELGRAYDRFGEGHPELLLWRRAWRTEKAMKRYAFAAATGDVAVFSAAVEESRLADIDPAVRLYEARVLRDTGDWPGAVYSLRRVLAQTSAAGDNKDRGQTMPDVLAQRAQAEDMLRDIECSILRSALEKSQGALQQARRNFYRYLEERGFSEKDRKPVAGQNWCTAAFNPLSVGREEAWAIFTTGITGALTGILGKPGAEADALAVYETQMTTAYLGLQAMIRLRQRGLTLDEINGLSTERLLKELPVRSVTGAPYTAAQAAQIGVAVREALKLPEVQALLARDEDSLRRALAQGYWNPRDVTDTWAEWIGDITSPKNLLQNLLPMSVGTVGGVPQGVRLWTGARAEAVAAMKAVGAAEGGTVVVARLAGFERAMQALASTERGHRLAEMMVRVHSRYEQLGLMDKGIWLGGKAVGGMALQGLADKGLEKLGGKELAFAGQMVGLFVGDEQLLIKFMSGSGQNPAVLAKLLQADYLPMLRQQVRELKTVQEEIGVWQNILVDLHGGKELTKLEASTQQVVQKRLAIGPVNQQVPNGNAGHDTQIALQGAAEGVGNNTDNGATTAAATLSRDAQNEIDTIAAHANGVETVAVKLAAAPPPRPVPPRPPPVDLDLPNDEFVSYRMPSRPRPGSSWAEAEQAMADGDFEKAEGLWESLIRDAREAAEAGKPLTKHELPLPILELKLQAARGRGAPPVMTGRPPFDAAAEVTAAEAEAAIQRAKDRMTKRVAGTSTAPPAGPPGQPKSSVGTGSSGKIDIADDFVVKEVSVGSRLAPEALHLQAQAEAEMVAARLNRRLGGHSPGVHVKVLEWNGNEPKRVAIVSRTVDGVLMNELKPEEIYAMRRELARHRVVSLLVGDYDRKLDNYKVSSNGASFAIDAGQGDVRGRIAEYNGAIPDDDAFLEGLNGRDHWYRRGFVEHGTGQPVPNPDFTNKVFFAESMLTYDDAAPALKELEALLKNNADELKREVRTAFTDLYRGTPLEGSIEQFVNETVGTMQDRAAKLDNVLRGLNRRNGVRLPPPTTTQVSVGPRATFGGALIAFPAIGQGNAASETSQRCAA